jgi:stress-induced morphogen
MPLALRGRTDEYLDAVMTVLAKYESQHPRAEIVGYRQNSVSIRIRIVDPDFANISRTDRHDTVWRVLDELPEEIQSHLSTILLLTPDEKKKSFASLEFDDPVPSKL